MSLHEEFFIFQKSSPYRIRLDKFSSMMAYLTTSCGIVFDGQIDIGRFIAALQGVGDICPWLFCAMSVCPESGDAVVIPRTQNVSEVSTGFFMCEYKCDLSQDYSQNIYPDSVYPLNCHAKMLDMGLASTSIEDLPIAAFRVVQYANHFTLGYRLNHAYYDQSSIVYLLTYLSALYTSTSLPLTKPPVFYPRVKCIGDDSSFSSKAEFDASHPEGYIHIGTSRVIPSSEILGTNPSSTICLHFNSSALQVFKSSCSEESISTNDLLHAILCKSVALFNSSSASTDSDAFSHSDDSSVIRVLFARNMRKYLSYGPEITGDYVHLDVLRASKQEVLSSSLSQLAVKNRQLVSTCPVERFRNNCMWYRDYALYHPDGSAPSDDYLFDKCAAVVTNWSSFPYENIAFDDSTPVTIIPPVMSTQNALFAIVFFTGKGVNRELRANIHSVYPKMLSCIQQCIEVDSMCAEVVSIIFPPSTNLG